MSADASHITEPDPTGESPARAMKMAIADAGVDPTDVGYVNAHATSTPLGDAAETKVIKIALGEEHARRRRSPRRRARPATASAPPARSRRSSRMLALRDRIVPPTINLETPDPDCDLDYVPNVAREVPDSTSPSSNSFGFGGHNATIVLAPLGLSEPARWLGRRRWATFDCYGTLIDWNGGIRADELGRGARAPDRGATSDARPLPRARARSSSRTAAAPTAR